jgi:hypothetical protein
VRCCCGFLEAYEPRKMSKKVRRKRVVVVGQDWPDAKIKVSRVSPAQRKFAVLQMLLVAALGLFAFCTVFFAVTGDREGIKAIMVIASNLITGGASWALGQQVKK